MDLGLDIWKCIGKQVRDHLYYQGGIRYGNFETSSHRVSWHNDTLSLYPLHSLERLLLPPECQIPRSVCACIEFAVNNTQLCCPNENPPITTDTRIDERDIYSLNFTETSQQTGIILVLSVPGFTKSDPEFNLTNPLIRVNRMIIHSRIKT